jgi:hypothetical protein
MKRRAVAAVALLATLAGCGGSLTDQFGTSVLVAPGKYDYYSCQHLQDADRSSAVRQKELEELMARAAKGPGGNVVGQMVYRSDYQVALADRQMIARQMTQKQCVLDSKRSSDRSMF